MLRMVSLQTGEVARRRVPSLNSAIATASPRNSERDCPNRLKEARLVVSGTDNEGTPLCRTRPRQAGPRLAATLELHQTGTGNHPAAAPADPRSRDLGEERTQERPSVGRKPRLPLLLELQNEVPERFNAIEEDFHPREPGSTGKSSSTASGDASRNWRRASP